MGAFAYPRLGLMYISNKEYDQVSVQTDIAKYDLSVIGAWKGWNKNGKNIKTVCQEIKTRNPGILIGNYTRIDIVRNHNSSADGDKHDKLLDETGPGYPQNNDWWARDKDGNIPADQWYPGFWVTNITSFVQPDGNGDRFSEWAAKRDWDAFFKDIPELDIWYLDDWFYKPRITADFNGDGTNDSRDDGTVQTYYREGYIRWLNEVRTLTSRAVMGNVTTAASNTQGALNEPEYKNMLEGAFMEHAAGVSWSKETWAGWSGMMRDYQNLIRNTKYPHAVIFNVVGNKTDYKFFRYTFASSLMDDGYFDFSPEGDVYRKIAWFDEYDLAGTSNTSWMGSPIDNPPTAAWQNGVWRREYDNALALVNPKGNTQRTVTLETGVWKTINGSQAPGVNDNTQKNSITLQDRDGIILQRVGAAPSDDVIPVLINCGGGQYTAGDGRSWEADRSFNTGNAVTLDVAIAGTNDDTLYQSERFDPDTAPELEYEFDPGDGDYTCKLHFAEIADHVPSTGDRIFTVRSRGDGTNWITQLNNYNIYATVGHSTVDIKTFNVTVSGGNKLEIDFVHVASSKNPKISAIEILDIQTGSLSAPTISQASGAYVDSVTPTITCNTDTMSNSVAGVTIYYTLDGSTPTTGSSSIASGGSVVITADAQLRAIGVKTGYNDSSIASANYTITYTDTTPPSVPVLNDPVVISDTQIDLSWSASTDPEGADVGYFVYRAGFTWTKINQSPSPATSYSVTGLEPGSQNEFAVSAIDTAGNESALSASKTATTTITGDIPGPPVLKTTSLFGTNGAQVNIGASRTPINRTISKYIVFANGNFITEISPSIDEDTKFKILTDDNGFFLTDDADHVIGYEIIGVGNISDKFYGNRTWNITVIAEDDALQQSAASNVLSVTTGKTGIQIKAEQLTRFD